MCNKNDFSMPQHSLASFLLLIHGLASWANAMVYDDDDVDDDDDAADDDSVADFPIIA